MLDPFSKSLDALQISYSKTVQESRSYFEHYDSYFGPLPAGTIQVGIAQYGGRLIPRSVVVDDRERLSQVSRFIAEKGVTWIGVGTNVTRFGSDSAVDGKSQNSVLPAWRDAIISTTLSTVWSFNPTDWDAMLAQQDLMTEIVMPALEAATPTSGVYMNEADFRQPNFQREFFGLNYDRLLSIKKNWDPEGLFYATAAVGSEVWEVAKDGRMCRR